MPWFDLQHLDDVASLDDWAHRAVRRYADRFPTVSVRRDREERPRLAVLTELRLPSGVRAGMYFRV